VEQWQLVGLITQRS